MPRYASLDIGTQTIRLLIADMKPNRTFIPVYRDRAIVRLGEGMMNDDVLQQEPMNRALTCVKNFVAVSHRYDVQKIFAVATAGVREAQNGMDFLHNIYETTGVTVRLLSGNEEASLSLRGVQSVFPDQSGHSLIIDIGGGSTECIVAHDNTTVVTESLPLGVIYLAERFLRSDPPRNEELDNLTNYIRDMLITNCICLKLLYNSTIDMVRCIGTAGTATTLAAMALNMRKYDAEKINGCLLTRTKIQQIYHELIIIPSKSRINIPGLEPGRETVIIPGARILLSIMELVKTEEILISDAGLLEGILLDAL